VFRDRKGYLEIARAQSKKKDSHQKIEYKRLSRRDTFMQVGEEAEEEVKKTSLQVFVF
jgi:hypothetical protein